MTNKFLIAAILFTLTFSLRIASYEQFTAYCKNFNKKNSDAMFLYRLYVYSQNMETIKILNDNPQDNAIYGQTFLTDLTSQQIKALMGLKLPTNYTIKYTRNFTRPQTAVPDIWDWSQQGAVSSVKNQGSCGSCWSFSTVGNIEGLNFIKSKEFVQYSQQQLIDCDKGNFGCSGGWPYNAIDWLAHHGGLMTLRDYPLRTNYSGPCLYKDSAQKINIVGYQNITHDQQIIKEAVYTRGPISILLDFTGLLHYKSGVANPLFCSTWPDHALVLVGYGTQIQDYWLIKNSWGPKWGINGYFMLKRGANKCAINLFATTAIL